MTAEEFAAGYETGFLKTVQFLRSRGISSDADEFAQAAWVRGWERREQIRQPSSLLVWINSIALNLYREQLRHPTTAIGDLQHRPGPQQNFMAPLELSRRMQACSAEQRTLLERFYIQGESVEEIANWADCSTVAVRIRLFRARQKLAAAG